MDNEDIMFNYNTSFTAEVEDSTDSKRKCVIISGNLMNDQMNANYWKVNQEDMQSVADQFKGTPIKMQHSNSDWEIIGTGISATVVGNSISFKAKITDTKAVDKFVTGTWTADNMGISPGMTSTKQVCSICSDNIRTCGHVIGQTYEDKKAYIVVGKPRVVESSLTSKPAYGPMGSGYVDNVNIEAFVASINKKKTEVLDMVDEIKPVDSVVVEEVASAVVVETATVIENTVETVVKETVETVIEPVKDEEKDALIAENKKIKEQLINLQAEFRKVETESRKTELSDIIKDETLVAEILSKEMTSAEFTAEVSKIKKIQALYTPAEVVETVIASSGSAPIEQGIVDSGKTLSEECFGLTAEKMAEKLLK